MPVPDDNDRACLGANFWEDPRTAAVVEDLAADRTDTAEGELRRLRVLAASEEAARPAAEAAVARMREEFGVTWAQIAEAVGTSVPAAMQRYSRKHRAANAARQRRRRES